MDGRVLKWFDVIPKGASVSFDLDDEDRRMRITMRTAHHSIDRFLSVKVIQSSRVEFHIDYAIAEMGRKLREATEQPTVKPC
jgi:hypothetical protein